MRQKIFDKIFKKKSTQVMNSVVNSVDCEMNAFNNGNFYDVFLT